MNKLFIMMIILISIAFTTCVGESGGNSKQNAPKSDVINQKTAVWLSFNEGLAKAKAEKKNMIVDFYTDWCHWCKVMDEKTFKEEKVNKKLMEKFVTVRIDAENRNETATYKDMNFNNVELTKAFGVSGFPSLAFLNAEGDIITIIPGYIPPETFIYILDYIDKECYKKQMSFEEFMKKKGECEDEEKKK